MYRVKLTQGIKLTDYDIIRRETVLPLKNSIDCGIASDVLATLITIEDGKLKLYNLPTPNCTDASNRKSFI